MITRRPAAERFTGVDDGGLLLHDNRYRCPCGLSAPLPLPALSALADRWSRDDDPHHEPATSLRFRAQENALLDEGAGRFLVQLTCACGAPATIVLAREEHGMIERFRVCAVLA